MVVAFGYDLADCGQAASGQTPRMSCSYSAAADPSIFSPLDGNMTSLPWQGRLEGTDTQEHEILAWRDALASIEASPASETASWSAAPSGSGLVARQESVWRAGRVSMMVTCCRGGNSGITTATVIGIGGQPACCFGQDAAHTPRGAPAWPKLPAQRHHISARRRLVLGLDFFTASGVLEVHSPTMAGTLDCGEDRWSIHRHPLPLK